MRISNKVKIIWWLIVLVLVSLILFGRRDILLSGNPTTFDGVIILIWVAILFTPLFSEMNIFGLQLKNEIKEIKRNVKETEKNVKAVSGNLPSWKLLYEHDENGAKISGTLERLIQAVEEGYQIKVKIHQSDGSIQVLETQWLFVDNDVVYATNTNHISLRRDETGKYVFQEDSYHMYVVLGSNGHHHATRFNIDGEKRYQTDSTRHMVWIGLVPPTTL